MTNIDRIKQMNAEEMAKRISFTCWNCAYQSSKDECHRHVCVEGIKAWLEQEAEEWLS